MSAKKSILIINSKGGSGKTTIATNLAACFAATGLRPALMDYDPQGSSQHWLALRPEERPTVININAGRSKSSVTRTWQLRVDGDVERVIMDAPAGASGLILQEMIQKCDMILIPVGPSAIDIHATSRFIQELLCHNRIRHYNIQLGVVANRVRNGTLYEPLQRFLAALKIPFLTMLNDSDLYIRAAESGIGIHEMERDQSVLRELEQWQPLLRWIDDPAAFFDGSTPHASLHQKVVQFPPSATL